jgi:hypothetical protein
VRKDIGVSEDVKVLLFNFGGQLVFLNKSNYSFLVVFMKK